MIDSVEIGRENEVVEMLTHWKVDLCGRLDGEEDQPVWSEEMIASISHFGVEISHVLEVLG